ncbi:MAG: DUF2236 domain-containing protein [Dehalococcoidia bacterium]|nr:DUF2236 domain-containing protein [Dehalococcoidia bacterium]
MFTDDSPIRRVHSESVILLGGGRALLMQIAHPQVARGVAEHSDFRADPLGRLLRTLRSTFAIAFGDEEQARAAAERINGVHARVTGAGYRATDPDLLLWVLATLIDTTLVVHRRFVGPLSPELAAGYYRDMGEVGVALGLPREHLPPDLAAFERYMDSMLDTMDVSAKGRALAAQLLRPLPGTAPVVLLVREVTAGLLPPTLRCQFGLTWDPAREALLESAARVSRATLPLIPWALRRTPGFLLPVGR